MSDNSSESRPSTTGAVGLLLAVAVIGVVWGALLPRLSETRRASERIRWLEEKNVDAAATYYTELEALKPTLERLRRRSRTNESPSEKSVGRGGSSSFTSGPCAGKTGLVDGRRSDTIEGRTEDRSN